MSTSRQALGNWGETVAANYLAERGYLVLDRNVRTKYGEIDLIATEGKTIVFIEVKTRSTTSYGYPEDAITSQKAERMVASAQAYLQDHPELEFDWRIDVIAIRKLKDDSEPEIIHFTNALS